MQHGFAAEWTAQHKYSDHQSDAHGNDRLTEKEYNVPEIAGCLQRGGNGTDQDQHNRKQQRQEGCECAGDAFHVHVESRPVIRLPIWLIHSIAFLVRYPVVLHCQILS